MNLIRDKPGACASWEVNCMIKPLTEGLNCANLANLLFNEMTEFYLLLQVNKNQEN